MQLLSLILELLRVLLLLGRSIIVFLVVSLLSIPFDILKLISPSFRRKVASFKKASFRFMYQSSQGVTLDIEIPNQQHYLKFLMETLQKISENRNSKLIYPFWEQNFDKLDDNLINILDNWAQVTLAQVTPQQAYSIALDIGNFSDLIQKFPLGNIAINQEIAITGSEVALTILTFEAFPQDWATGKNNLANAYSDRIRGKKDENLERAITLYQEALKVYTFESFPQEWATGKNNLAIAYCDRIGGDKADNLEIAIAACNEALKVRTFEAFPQDWARTQNNLATAYLYRIKGKKAENLETAISTYNEALKVLTFDTFPHDWATTRNNLAAAYSDRIRGKKAENLETAISIYNEALKVYTFESFPYDWARTQNYLAVAYTNRIRGDKAENLETAIAAYNEALKVLTFDTFPQDWALTQNNLAAAYSDRIRGEKAKNLEMAISIYNEALKVLTFDTFPHDWARTQNNLAAAYSDRIRGKKAENLETAISIYNEALKVYTFESFAQEWARTQNNLANAYLYRIRGKKAENLETAISTYNEALKVYTLESFPYDWARTQNNLANAYLYRIRGDKAENLDTAISYLQEALKVYTLEAFPYDWARTQNNLASAYLFRIRGKKAENLDMAISYLQEALKVLTFDTFPQDWANTQNSLAVAYSLRIRGDKAENLETAITYFQEALKVRTFDTFPQDWASTKYNLASAYLFRIRGKKAENLETAITYFQEAFKVLTFEAFPQDWARTQNNLALAYSNRIRGEKAENLERAIAFYHNALTIYTKENDPLNCLNTALNLANLYYKEKEWQPATEAYNTAIEAIENSRLEALNPHSRQEVLANAIVVFHRIVQAHLNLNQPEKALEYVERSKGRNLVELMTQKSLQPQGVNQEIVAQLNELKQKVVSEQIRLQSQSINQNLTRSDNLTPYVQDHNYLKKYQQELEDFIEKEIKPIDPIFNLTQKVEPIPFADIQSLTDAETCLLQWYITTEKILAFVVSADREVKVWQSSEDERNQLIDTINNYLQLYYSKNGKTEWRNQLSSLLQTFADILHINEILTLIPDTCKRLIIIPHWFLHILPLHALPISNSALSKVSTSNSPLFKGGWGGSELHDLFPNGIQYAPSCQLLKIAQNSHHTDFNKLFAIQNPTQDLLFTDLEVNILSTFFTESQIIAKDNATKNAVLSHLKSSDNHCHHFSCHSGFNPANPLESALFLANKEPLTLGKIFELRLNQCRLVTLSACETGLIDLNSISDEYIGLPSGFLFAGSPSVVSSLWTVNDLSTSFLMIKFYEILFNPNLNISVAVALKQAQNWLQNLTIEKLDEFLQQYQPQIDKYSAPLRPGQRKIYEESLKQIRQRQPHPFANPYYWAGFTATGI